MSWSSDLLLWDGFCYSIFHPFCTDKRLISDMIVIKLQLDPLLATWQLTVCAASISTGLFYSLRVYEIMWWQSSDDHLHPLNYNYLSCLPTAPDLVLLYIQRVQNRVKYRFSFSHWQTNKSVWNMVFRNKCWSCDTVYSIYEWTVHLHCRSVMTSFL